MQKLALLRAGGTITDVRPPRLERLEVRAGGDLAIEPLSGEPDLQVVGLGGREAHVPSAEQHPAIRQAEALQHSLGVARQPLMLGVRVFGTDELHQLDLLELVLPDNAAAALAVGARPRRNTRSVRAIGDRKLRLVEGFVAEEIG